MMMVVVLVMVVMIVPVLPTGTARCSLRDRLISSLVAGTGCQLL